MTKFTKGPWEVYAELNVRSVSGDADGMTLRDYFAAKAMQGFIARDNWAPAEMVATGFDEFVSKCAYETADAMLKERAK